MQLQQLQKPAVDGEEFVFDLPAQNIAKKPVRPRDQARMLALDRESGKRTEHQVQGLDKFVQQGDIIVVNDSKVVPGVVLAKRENGTEIQIRLVSQKSENCWDCGVDSTRPLKEGEHIFLGEQGYDALVIGKNWLGTGYFIHFSLPEGLTKEHLLEISRFFNPAYLPSVKNPDCLQSIFATQAGSFQAPCAGLHFTKGLLKRLKEKQVEVLSITQHVGRLDHETFLAQGGRLDDHRMYEEWYKIPEETATHINAALERGSRILAVGTSVARALESSVITESGQLKSGQGWSNLFIRPGFEFKIVKALLSNFHASMSIPLVMACAFAGTEQTMEHYRMAVREQYRFLQFGDAALYL